MRPFGVSFFIKKKKPQSFLRYFFVCEFKLSGNIRQKSHEAGAFDGGGQQALILGSDAGAFVGNDASVRIEKLFQKLHIFVVDVFDVILREVALFVCHDN